MAKSTFMVLLVLALVGVWQVKWPRAGVSAAQCNEERRFNHVECLRPVITPKLAALVDVNRAIRLVEGCGRRVPRHFKCGSITTP